MDVMTLTAIVVAVAAVVTAGATLVLAQLSRGTWRLYELERSLHRASAARAAIAILREADIIRRELKRFGPASPEEGMGGWEVTRRIVARRTGWLNARVEALDALRNATELGLTAVAYLDLAFEIVVDGMGYWEELVEVVETEDDAAYRRDRELVMEHLDAASGALASAYESLPKDLRDWSGTASEYGEAYEAAREQNAALFPTAHRYLRSSRLLPRSSHDGLARRIGIRTASPRGDHPKKGHPEVRPKSAE